LFLSSVVSGIGGQLQSVANLWQVYALTGSALHLGLTGVARAIAIILFSLVGGVIADRVDRGKIIILTQATNGIVAVILGLLTAAGLVEVWHIYAATFFNATMMSLSSPARRAVIAGLVPRHHLMNAMALNSVLQKIDRIVAPSVAGVLIATVGLAFTYEINGVAHFVTAVALAFIALGPLPMASQVSPLQSLLEGLAFMRVRNIILVLLATDAAAMLFGNYTVLLPILSDRFDAGPTGFGLLSSAPAIGGFIGATAVMWAGDFPYRGRFIVGSILAYCVFLLALAVAPTFSITFLVAVGLGLTDTLQATPRNAAIQLLSPDQLRGRVSSVQNMLAAGIPEFGKGVLGSAADLVGAPIGLVAGALLCAGINVAILARRRDLRARDLELAAEMAPSPSGRGWG
jgi:MFS family permease